MEECRDLRDDEVEAPPPPMMGPPPPSGGPPMRGMNQGGGNAQGGGSLSDEIQGSGSSTWRSKTFPNKSATGLTGLCNQGATCYLNSLLQTLFMTPELRLALYRWSYNPEIDGPERTCIPLQLQRLFSRLQFSHCPYLETINLTTSFNWVGSQVYEQHDVQELCRVLFEAIDKTFVMNGIPNTIFPLYTGSLHDYLRCTECNYSSVREDFFMDLQLVIRGFKNLRSALIGYITPEVLEGNNRWFCEVCQKKVVALKGLRIYKLPKLLTLQLKRFEFDWKTESRKKVNDRLGFLFYLDLSDIVLKDISLEQAKSNQKKIQQNNDELLSTGGNIPAPSASSNRSQWSCALCTYSNDPTYVMCEMCFTPRPQEATPPPPVITPSSSTSEAKPTSNESEVKEATEQKQQAEEDDEEDEDKDEERPVITEENSGRVYELYSVLVHSGSAMGGHYYVYIKSLTSDQWYNFNDQTVTFLTQRQVRETFGELKAKQKQQSNDQAPSEPPKADTTTPNKRPSKWTTSADAYVLMYRRMDLNSQLLTQEIKVGSEQQEGMLNLGEEDIPKQLKQEIQDENKEYVEEKAKWEVRINTLSLKIYFDNPYEKNRRDNVVISILKNSSVLELLVATHQTINQYLQEFYLKTTNKEGEEQKKEELIDKQELRMEDMRLRHYNIKTGNCGAVIVSKQQINIAAEAEGDSNNNTNSLKTLEQLAIYQDKTIFCEFKGQTETDWKSGDLNEVGLTISILRLSKAPANTEEAGSGSTTPMTETWEKIRFENEKFANKNIREITTTDLQEQIAAVFSIPPSRQTIARINGAEIEFFCLGSKLEDHGLSLVEDLGITDGGVAYVEDLEDPQVALIQNVFPAPSLIRQKFEVEKNLITLKLFSSLFASDDLTSTGGSERTRIDVVSDLLKKQSAVSSSGTSTISSAFSRKDVNQEKLGTIEIVVDQRMKLGQLRSKISELIGKHPDTNQAIVEPEEVEIHKKLLRGEYKNDNATLQELSLYEDCNLLIVRGAPSLLNQFKCKLFLSSTVLPSLNSNTLSLISDKFTVNQNWSISDMKKRVAALLGVKTDNKPPQAEAQFQEDWRRVRIRIKKKGGGFGEVIKGADDKPLHSMEEPLLDEMEWIVTLLPEPEKLDEEELVIEIRRWSQSTDEGQEKLIGKWWRVADLRRECGRIAGISGEIKVKKGMRSGLGLLDGDNEGWDVGDDEVVSGRPMYLKDGDLMYWKVVGDEGGIPGWVEGKEDEEGKPVRRTGARRKEPGLVIKTVYDM